MSKVANFFKILFSIILVLAGSYAVYYALHRGNPSVCQDGACAVQQQVTPGRFSDYSWEDIVTIADYIKNAPTPDDAQLVAKRYNLVDGNGNLTDETNHFLTNDGVRIDARVIGIAADEGSGLTLMSSVAPFYRNVNTEDTTNGSWEDSDVRAWLNGEVLNSFPSEIKNSVKQVQKITNNADGGGVKGGTLSETKDSLWLFSVSEICGDVTWFDSRYHVRNSDNLDKTLSAQGPQYRYFRENGVGSDSDPKGVLKMTYNSQPVSWWLRSPYLFKFDAIDSNFWFDVTSEGYAFNYQAPNAQSGIVFGFCL